MDTSKQDPGLIEIGPASDSLQYTYPVSYLHYRPERVDYSVTGEELERFQTAGQSLSKDVLLVSISLAIPCLINAVEETVSQPGFTLTLPMFLNYLVAVVAVAAAIPSLVLWLRNRRKRDILLKSLSDKPKMMVIETKSR
jgi:hypothetical protein